jgi:TorA maturation chaperone TorD
MVDTEFDSESAKAGAAAGTCGLLARLWSREMDAESLSELVGGSVGALYSRAGGWLPIKEQVDQSLIEELAIEFCKCFIGPNGHLPPYQSVVVKSRFQSECCDSLKGFSELVGEVTLEGVNEQPMADHAAVELAMMGRIQQSLRGALDDDEVAAISGIREVAAAFFEQHLAWLVDYCDVAGDRSDSHFYRGLFRVTSGFLKSEFV